MISRRFANNDTLQCRKYYKMNGANVGCEFSYTETQRFDSLDTWLYYINGSLAKNQKHQLKQEGMRNQQLVIHYDLQ